MLLELAPLEFHFQSDRHLVNLILTGQEHQYIAWRQALMDFYTFLDGAVDVAFRSVPLVEDCHWEHLCFHFQYWNREIEQSLVLEV